MTGTIHIVGEDGSELPVGEEGEVWFETDRTFEYHRDPEKTKAAFDSAAGAGSATSVGSTRRATSTSPTAPRT